MINELAIRDRFVLCLDEVRKGEINVNIAEAIGCTPEYLSAIRKAKSPALPSAVIARFCHQYKYNPAFILLGSGSRKIAEQKSEKLAAYEQFETERTAYLELIAKLFDYVLNPLNKVDVPDDALTDLLKRANKNIKRN